MNQEQWDELKQWSSTRRARMIEPVAWIGQDAFAALLGGETICQTMTPSQAMYDDVPLTVIPPGFAIVPVEPTEAMIEAYLTAQAQYCLDVDKRMGVIRPTLACAAGLKAMLTAAKGE